MNNTDNKALSTSEQVKKLMEEHSAMKVALIKQKQILEDRAKTLAEKDAQLEACNKKIKELEAELTEISNILNKKE